MRPVILSLAAALIGAGAVSFSVVPSAQTRTKDGPNVFLLPPSDGYGVADCLSGEGECGKIVANAWCESKGFRKAVAFGPVSPTEITGSIGRAGTSTPAEPPLMISCGD